MYSFAIVFTATFLGLDLAPAASAPSTQRQDAPRPAWERGDEGVRFTCPRRQLPALKLAMAAYLTSLAIPEHLVARTERSAQGVLVYTLATPAPDTSTLDLASRPALDIARSQVSVPNGLGKISQVTTVSQKEILLALLQHGRLTDLRGPDCDVDALADHVALRQNIVAWAENLRWGWPDGGPAAWNESYWNRGTPKQGVPLRQAIDDVFINQRAYAIGCYTATKLVIVKGFLDYYDRVRESPLLSGLIESRLLADHEPLVDVEPGRAWSFEPGFDPKESRPGKLLSIVQDVPPKNFVPGDWVYFLNTDPVSQQKIGYEGSNAIYLGGGRFDDYYGENNHAFTYEEKLDEVFQWRHGVWSRTRDAAKKQPLTAEDLERLSAAPGRGGLVEDWRIAPDFFAPPVRHGTPSRLRSAPGRSAPWHLSAATLAEKASSRTPFLASQGIRARR
jgi:hypothetical protein